MAYNAALIGYDYIRSATSIWGQGRKGFQHPSRGQRYKALKEALGETGIAIRHRAARVVAGVDVKSYEAAFESEPRLARRA
ncbi:MAG: hypothetical protein ACLUEQ_02205 [Cloacibacillus evryensis]